MKTPPNIRDAFKFYEKGKLDLAKRICKSLLKRNHYDFNATVLLGGIFLQKNKLQNSANCFSKAVKLNPNHHETYNSLGIVLAKLDQIDKAIINYQKAIQLNPNFHQAYYNLAISLQKQSKFEDAVINYQKAIELNPNNYEAYNNLANSLSELDNIDQAILNYEKAIQLNPNYYEAHRNLAKLQAKQQSTDQAIVSYEQIIRLNPNNDEAYYELGNLFVETNRLNQAITCFKKAVGLNSKHYKAYNNLGLTLHNQNKFDEALLYYQKVIEIKPDMPEIYNNIGIVLQKQNKFDEAQNYYEKAIQMNPNYHEAYFNLGRMQLYFMDFINGWKNYQHRNQVETDSLYNLSMEKPKYTNQDLNNKTLYLYPEQGYGDNIMVMRLLNNFLNMNVNIILYTSDNLYKLLQKNFPSVTVTHKPYQGDYDYYLPIMDMPMVLNINHENIPLASGYLSVDHTLVQAYKTKLLQTDKKNIGIAWKGNQNHKNDHNRSFDLETFLRKINRTKHQQYYSLQVDISDHEKQLLSANNILDLGSNFSDFYDTAIAISCLDALICVDTAIAHLSGALNIPTWVLLPKINVDWRWGHQGSTSYWYDSITLIRDDQIINL
ncbi:tetratricopeptide repeat protein [Thiotrichales bacterium 19S9-12]|nr:tetratricopeptide repeat protein [Thiotrichales bacterium 19S9-11]MCF6811446.1 tetratricopeptide repeat protein [Thiotrichales bacterium 19S9-12]